ncbi:Variant SH3 domain [Plasmodiophora brassicae]
MGASTLCTMFALKGGAWIRPSDGNSVNSLRSMLSGALCEAVVVVASAGSAPDESAREPGIAISLPPRVFWRNRSARVVNERRRMLQSYLNALQHVSAVWPDLCRFVEAPVRLFLGAAPPLTIEYCCPVPQQEEQTMEGINASSGASDTNGAAEHDLEGMSGETTSQASFRKSASNGACKRRGELYRCLAPFSAGSSNQLSLSLGEIVAVVATDTSKGWHFGRNQSGRFGYVPAPYLERL